MSDKIEYSRLLLKRTGQTGQVPTIPTGTTLNEMIPTDLFIGEMYLNAADDALWVRTDNGIYPISLSGITASTPDLGQVLFQGNFTNGEDIIVSAGNTIVFSGLSSGSSTNLLAIDASGNTITVTGSTGGGGTNGTSGTSGTDGTSGTNGSSGTSGAAGSSGTSGTGGGGSSSTGTHFNFPPAPGNRYSITQTGGYIESGNLLPFEQWIIAYPITPGRNISISAMTCDWYRTYSQTDGRIKLLIYDNNSSKYIPNNLLSESAAITTQQFVTLQYNVDYTFSAGTTYWVAIAFNDKMEGTDGGGNQGMIGTQLTGLLSIGAPKFLDGYGLMWKAAVSATNASLTIPSTWTVPSSITAFNGSYLWPDEGGYYGGQNNNLPDIRLKIA